MTPAELTAAIAELDRELAANHSYPIPAIHDTRYGFTIGQYVTFRRPNRTCVGRVRGFSLTNEVSVAFFNHNYGCMDSITLLSSRLTPVPPRQEAPGSTSPLAPRKRKLVL